MWTKQRRTSITINSLVYQCLKSIFQENCSTKIFNHEHDKQQFSQINSNQLPNDEQQQQVEKQRKRKKSLQQQQRIECHDECKKCIKLSQLPIDLKQIIFDFIIQEKLLINIDILINLIKNGGIYYFDLWTISDLNEYTNYEIKKLLLTLFSNTKNIRELIIGGQWIYDEKFYNEYLIEIFIKRKFFNLIILRMQQVNNLNEFLSIFNSCPKLKILDICQPSLNDRDILKINKNIFQNNLLTQLKLPSTIKNFGSIKLMNLFTHLNTLKCSRFDYITDYLSSSNSYDSYGTSNDNFDEKEQIKLSISKLINLTITLPISNENLIDIIKYCPNLQQLSILVNEDLNLLLLENLKNLTKLRLINQTTNSLIFEEKVVPLIKIIGKNLEILSLEHFEIIDLRFIILECIHLKTLSIQYFLTLSLNIGNLTYLTKYERNRFFKKLINLNKLRLRPRIEGTIKIEIINYFLTYAINIETIELYFCHNLSDKHLLMINNNNKIMNKFLNLKSLIIKHGHLINEKSVKLLTKYSNNLQYLDIGKPLINKLTDEHNNDDDYRFNQLFE